MHKNTSQHFQRGQMPLLPMLAGACVLVSCAFTEYFELLLLA